MTEKIKHSLMQNADNRFFYDKRRYIIHDRQCALLDSHTGVGLVSLNTITPSDLEEARLCPKCRRNAAIRNGMRGRLKNRTEQMRFFSQFFCSINAHPYDLERLFILNEGSLEYISPNCVEIYVKEDRWRVAVIDGELTLLHNNYDVNDDYSRTFLSDFHVQTDYCHPTFYAFTKIICTYSFDYHRQQLEAYDAKVRLLKLETELAITNNYTRCKRLALLHRYYTYVDIPDNTARKPVRGMKVLDSTNKDNYTIITCRIPYWSSKDFELKMGDLKNRALAEKRFDYLEICINAVPQLA